jgi:hypothetical protein
MSAEPALGWATKQELRAFSDAVAPQIVELLDTSGLALPRRVHQYAKTAVRSFSFTREVKLSQVVEVVAFLAVYGEYKRLFALARTVAPVPHTGNETVYEPVRLIVHAGYYFAGQQANDAVTAELAPYRFVPADFWRPRGYLAGEHLQRQFELPPDEAAQYASHPVSYHAGISADDLPPLASMHVCGGSSTWPLERIEAQVAKTIAAVHAYRGFAPPAGP